MRQSETAQTGGIGEAAVSYAFVALGWGVVEVPTKFDLGTDLLLLVRDERRFDPGLVVGVQVKSGPSAFDEPMHDDTGQITGWWFRDEDRKHIAYWVDHLVPHLIILHDLTTSQSYWAHITPNAVVEAGKSAKVFVPRENIVDAAHRDALLAVSATARPPSMWEGSAWSGITNVAPSDLLRHALLVPRLVAPHRSTQPSDSLRPEQVAAMLAQSRFGEIALRRPPLGSSLPNTTEMSASADWKWQFVAAFETRLLTSAVDSLVNLAERAPDSPSRTAAIVVAAAGMLEVAKPDEAIELIEPSLSLVEHLPIDNAWLMVQLARAYIDIGRFDDAAEIAEKVQTIRLTHAHDVTATAIAGVAAMQLFALAEWGAGDTGAAIGGMDTTAVWWRFQHVARGAAAAVEREFTRWSKRASEVVGDDDTSNEELYAAALLASHLGDHGGWRSWESLNMQQAFLSFGRTTNSDRVLAYLSALRLSGAEKALARAVDRIMADGPAHAVAMAASRIDFTRWTRTIWRSNIAMLEHGSDVLDTTVTHSAVSWLLATINDDRAFVARTRPNFRIDLKLIDALAAVVRAATADDQRVVAKHIIELPPQTDQSVATSWRRVVRALPISVWSANLGNPAIDAATPHHDVLRQALLGATATIDDRSQQQLLTEIRAGSLAALVAIKDTSTVPKEMIPELITRLEQLVSADIVRARESVYQDGYLDAGRTLAIINAQHPEVARWEPIYDLLADPTVATDNKRGLCDDLTGWANKLTSDVQQHLLVSLQVVLETPASPADLLEGLPDALGPAARLTATLARDNRTTESLLIRLLPGNDDHRIYAIRIATESLESQRAIAFLAPLAQDLSVRVRACAASALAHLVAGGTESHLAIGALRQAIADQGILVPRNVASTLAHHHDLSSDGQELLTQLESHMAASVRAAAKTV